MQFWIIQGLNSLSLGALLFLLASGFSLIFGLMRLANLTHGAFFMLGTYFGATALRQWSGLNIWVTALGAGIAVAALGGLFERLVLTRLKTNPLGQVLVTLGMSFIISDACLMLWGGDFDPGADAAEPAGADPDIRICIPDLPAGAGGMRHRGCDRAVFPARADAARRDDPRRRRRPADGARRRHSGLQSVHAGVLPRRRASRAPAACWADRSCPPIRGSMPTCFRWR